MTLITNENYFAKESNLNYMSASQFKMFMDCEAAALAAVRGEYEREKTTALLVGSFVDAYFSNSLEQFKVKNPDIFTAKGSLKSEFKQAEYIITRIERDPMMKKYLSGQPQVPMTGLIASVPFKILMDSYHPGKAIVDLKVVKDFEKQWKDGLKLSFIEFWKYDVQLAIYQAVEGNRLPVFIAAATKEKEPDISLISIPQDRLDYCLGVVKTNVARFQEIKTGKIEPVRCEHCDYCKSSKVISQIISYEEVGA